MPKPKKEMALEEPIKFYNGEETLQFDRANWRWYRVLAAELCPLDGVTGVVHIIDKSLYLTPWAAKMVYVKAMKIFPRIEDADGRVFIPQMPIGDFDALMLEAKGAHKEKLEDAGDGGELAHGWLSNSIKAALVDGSGVVESMDLMAPTDERALACGDNCHKWMVAHNVRWQSTERPVYSRKYGYAGTADGTALVDSCLDPSCCPSLYEDMLCLIDFKSSNQLSIEYLYQTAAYEQALEEELGIDIKARWVLRLGKEKGDFESWFENDFDNDFAGYLAALNLTRQHKKVTQRMAEAKKLRTFNKRAEKALTKTEEAERKKKMKFAKRKADAVQ